MPLALAAPIIAMTSVPMSGFGAGVDVIPSGDELEHLENRILFVVELQALRAEPARRHQDFLPFRASAAGRERLLFAVDDGVDARRSRTAQAPIGGLLELAGEFHHAARKISRRRRRMLELPAPPTFVN